MNLKRLGWLNGMVGVSRFSPTMPLAFSFGWLALVAEMDGHIVTQFLVTVRSLLGEMKTSSYPSDHSVYSVDACQPFRNVPNSFPLSLPSRLIQTPVRGFKVVRNGY
jgi:hypothetical protein